MASAASADLTYDVDEDSGVWLDADDFQEIYEDDNGGYLEYVEFTDYDDFDDYGYFTFEDFDRYGFDDVDSKALENYEFYYDRADADDYDIDLDTLRFETYDNIDSDTLDFDVRLYGDEGSFYATVRIDVEGGSRSGSGGPDAFFFFVSAWSSCLGALDGFFLAASAFFFRAARFSRRFQAGT
mgnify:CR=1 FL=1